MASSSSPRAPTELRPLSAQHNILARADGSASFGFGTLVAYAASTGPIEARIREELIDRAALQITVTPLVGLPGIAARGLAQALTELFESVILLRLHPRSVIQLNVQLVTGPPIYAAPSNPSISDDALLIEDVEQAGEGPGSASASSKKAAPLRTERPSPPHPNSTFSVSQRATVINAAMLAFLDSGVPMQATVATCACAYIPLKEARRLRKRRRRSAAEADAMDSESDSASILVLDPTPEEEHYATSTHVFAFGFAGKAPPPTSSSISPPSSFDVDDFADAAAAVRDADEEEELLYAESHGPVELHRYTSAVAQCRLAAREFVVPFYRRWLLQQHAKQ
ncbi:hypothetical protein V8E36_008202 [Tilletia maclaganii]